MLQEDDGPVSAPQAENSSGTSDVTREDDYETVPTTASQEDKALERAADVPKGEDKPTSSAVSLARSAVGNDAPLVETEADDKDEEPVGLLEKQKRQRIAVLLDTIIVSASEVLKVRVLATCRCCAEN